MKNNTQSKSLRILLMIDFSESFGRDIIKGISDYAKQSGCWSLCRMPLQYREKHGIKGVLRWAKQWKADGIVAQVGKSSEIIQLKKSGIPFIVHDLENRSPGVTYLSGNYVKTGKMAAEYFIDRGFKHLAYYGFSNIYSSRERLQGFMNIAERHSLSVQTFLSSTKNEDENELWYYRQSPLTKWLKSLPKPIALFAFDDNQALYVAEACRLAAIKIPDEVSILGVDNDETICLLSNPPLSSIVVNAVQGGLQAARALELMIAKKINHPDILNEPTHIITRQSTDINAVSDPIIKSAIHFIQQKITQKILVSDILKHVSISRRMLEVRFKETTGKTIKQFIDHTRIELVIQLLSDSDLPISEIAYRCGFNDNHNLSRLFIKHKKMTPLEYKKRVHS